MQDYYNLVTFFQVQERLVRIFATHQAEVQELRRDLHCTRVALFKQKSLLSSSRGMLYYLRFLYSLGLLLLIFILTPFTVK